MDFLDEPATWKQLRVLSRCGYQPDHRLTKHEASRLISSFRGEPEKPDRPLETVAPPTANAYQFRVFVENELDAAMRYDHYSQFASTTPKLGVKWTPVKTFALRGTYSEGFRAPALLELTCAGPAAICPGLQAGAAPDPPLNPVRVRNFEIGVRSRPVAGTSAQLSVYRTEVFDDIFSVSPSGTTGIFFQNTGRTRRQGLETM